MARQFQRESGDWTQYRSRFNLTASDEVDLHCGERDPTEPYENVLAEVIEIVEDRLKRAQESGRPYLLFNHGHSTSGPGKKTARSQVRKFTRSYHATPPLIERKHCIQHHTVFVAKIRPTSTLAS
jgi:hypothetical protein